MTADRPRPPALPPATFDVLVQMLAAPCLVHLGIVENPATGKKEPDLVQARFVIDLLHVLEERTRSSVSPEERARFDQLLHQLRTAYASAQR